MGSATPRPGKHIAIHGNQVVLRGVRKSDAGFILALRRHRPEKRAVERSLFRSGIGVPAE